MDSSYIKFLTELRENNERPWFQANKARYDELREQWLDEINRLINNCTEWEPAYRWLTAKECVYRIYRDTRFSPDKTPYKTYFSALITPKGKTTEMAGYYVQAGLDDSFSGLYGGLWSPDREALRKMRHAIVDNIEEFEEIINEPSLVKLYPHWSEVGHALKTIPKGWPKDHPQAELLRLQDYGREHLLTPKFFTDKAWPEKAAEMLRPLQPLIHFINYTLFEEE